MLVAETTYDVPPTCDDRKLYADRHRRREESAIVALDENAAAAARTKKAHERQELRRMEAEVRSVLEYTIFRLERQHEYEATTKPLEAAIGLPQRWSCCAGCESGACARAAFRLQCVPSSSDIVAWLQKRWERHLHGVVQFGDFSSPSGYKYSLNMQLQLQAQQEQELEDLRPNFFQECISEVNDIQQAFLEKWDGKVDPLIWLESHAMHGRNQTSYSEEEYLGPEHLKQSTPDQFGPDRRPVGSTACARRGCTGCCYCHNAASPPVYLQVRTRTWGAPAFGAVNGWVTLDELQQEVESLASSERFQPFEALPVYLLERRAIELYDRLGASSTWQAMYEVLFPIANLRHGKSGLHPPVSTS